MHQHFIFYFLLVWLIDGFELKNINKRSSLVSRFTSNPFFLKHFSNSGDYQDYEIFQMGDRFFTQTDSSEEEVYENHIAETEKPEIFKYQQPQVVTEKTEAEKNESFLYIFKSLPLFDRSINFKKIENNGGGLYIFRSLPHFDSRFFGFRKPQRRVIKIVRKKVLPIQTIADLPLQEVNFLQGPYDSYGKILQK